MYPEIRHIDSCLRAISGSDEFIVKRDNENGLLFINYLFNTQTTFPDPALAVTEQDRINALLRRECRGIEFDMASGDIRTRKFAKFFNINEKPETQSSVINWSGKHWVLEKLDGSMITPFVLNGVRQYHTKMGLTDVAVPVNKFVRESSFGYDAFCNAMAEDGKTSLFEWTSLQQKIVIRYDTDSLVLTAIRDTVSGEYVPYPDMVALAEKYNIPCVKASENSVGNISEFLETTKKLVGVEGCVIRFDDGRNYKVKGEWYCLIHNTKDSLSQEKNVWALFLENTLDDARPFMDEEDRNAVDAFVGEFSAAIERTAHRLKSSVEAYREKHDTKKSFAMAMMSDASVPAIERPMLFSIWDNQEPMEAVLRVLRGNISTATKVENIRSLVGGLRWNRFYKTSVEE